MPLPPTRYRPDTMKDTILKESTTGWANNNITNPLRIAKRDQPAASSSSSPAAVTRVVARRSSNSYRHMFNNNLVSMSPFRSQIPAPSPSSPRPFPVGAGGADVAANPPRTARKVSGEKRPRPISLIEQTERENAVRVNELGYKRRQSKGFQGLVEKEPVTKSPFRRIVSPNNIALDAHDDMDMPIAIELPTNHRLDEDTTSPETTETDSSLNSREGANDYTSPPAVKPVMTPERPLTPPSRPVQQRFTPSPTFERRSPIPSALQGSPARSSLIQKPRLIGPRSRSLSAGGSPTETPKRERRKTVTFDERCDVVEFDRESHEDAVFETDDEDVYGAPEPQQGLHMDSSIDSSNASSEYAAQSRMQRVMEVFDATDLDESINGLVDSMLQEASTFSGEPSTPEMHSNSLSAIAADLDMMAGGAEDGVPLGRSHHAERTRIYQQEMDAHYEAEPPIPGPFTSKQENATHSDMSEDHPSFSEISLSTPPRPAPALPELLHTPQIHATPHDYRQTSLPVLPPGTERAEDGMPLGRTHHADRARAARDKDVDNDVNMLSPSQSSAKRSAPPSSERELPDPLMPKFDLGLDGFRTSSPCGAGGERSLTDDDVFGTPNRTRDILADLEFDHLDIDADMLSNTSIASFHEFPPLPSLDAPSGGQEGSRRDHERRRERREKDRNHNYSPDASFTGPSERSRDISFGHSDLSLDASVASIVNGLKIHNDQESEKISSEDRDRTESGSSNDTEKPDGRAGTQIQGAQDIVEDPMAQLITPLHNRNGDLDPGPSPSTSQQAQSRCSLYEHAEGQASQVSITGSDNGRSRSPRVSREDVMRKLVKQRSMDNFSPLGTPSQSLASQAASPMPKVDETEDDMTVEAMEGIAVQQSQILSRPARSPLEERLKRVVSPTLVVSAPVQPPQLSSASPIPASPALAPTASPSPAAESPPSVFAPAPSQDLQSQDIRSTSTPSRPDLRARANTFDFTGRPLAPHPPVSAQRSPLSPTFDFSQAGVDIAEMDMRSALDRLVDDVSIASGGERVNTSARADRSGATVSSGDASVANSELITEESIELLASLRESMGSKDRPSSAPPTRRAGTAPSPAWPTTVVPRSRTASAASDVGVAEGSNPPPPPFLPPKTPDKSARQAREDMIKEKRRQARARESGEYFVPPRRNASGNLLEVSPASRRKSVGIPMARRSLSTGDAEDLQSVDDAAAQRRVSLLKEQLGGVLGMTLDDVEVPLTDSIERELKRMVDPKKKSYELREREAVVYASSSQEESLSRTSQVGDLDESKAWRTVRRPSDMNEYARQIREYRAQEAPGKTHGKVFVKVLRIRTLNVPMPSQQTAFTCTLNNGIHFVTTPECRLTRDAKIEQEFELIEHSKLEFTLTFKVRLDPHIVAQIRAITPPKPAPTPMPAAAPSHRSGMRSFFGGSPKKPKAPKHVRAQTEPIVKFMMEENLARYLKHDGTLARAFVAFKEIAPHCDTRLFETAFPLIGQRLEAPGEGGGSGGTMVPMQVGEIILQIFRLPPLPGIQQNLLPQSLDECHRGLRHISWHKKTYFEGILTQLGGDCSTWRRRQLRVIGGSLVAFNDVTKRATATIELKKALAVEDEQGARANAMRDVDDFDAMYGVERSFRLVFPHNQEIMFFADTDEEKAKWLEVFRALVGNIPPHPLWAELLWQRQNELKSSFSSSSNSGGESSRKQR